MFNVGDIVEVHPRPPHELKHLWGRMGIIEEVGRLQVKVAVEATGWDYEPGRYCALPNKPCTISAWFFNNEVENP